MPRSSPQPSSVLLVEDDESLADALRLALKSRNYDVTHVEDGDFALDLLETNDFDVILSDIRMPQLGGIELLREIRKAKRRVPVILMTAFDSTGRAIEATKNGAFDYLAKPFRMEELFDVLEKAIANGRLSGRKVTITPDSDTAGDSFIGSTEQMREVFKQIGRLVDKPVNVLIRGETGTGKELVARSLYQYGNRSERPFVAVNCAAIPDSLIESELFGHEKGAFTHAVGKRIGRFEQADTGTIFLDEVGDLPLDTQVKLLRVLQEQMITRVGGNESIQVDVRVISATHRNLEELLVDGKFREDLYYRLNGAGIDLPPLRDRLDDIAELTDYFLLQSAREFAFERPQISPAAISQLKRHPWPGNVRELENVIRAALINAQGMTVGPDHINKALDTVSAAPRSPDSRSERSNLKDNISFAQHIRARLKQASIESVPPTIGVLETLTEEMERELYTAAVEMAFGNQTTISKWLGVSRFTVREKLDKYKIFPKRDK